MVKTYVISLGGSVVVTKKINLFYITQFSKLLTRFARKGYRFVVVLGGGSICRDYQNAAKRLCRASARDLDLIGIASTKLNAELVRSIFGTKAHPEVVSNPEKRLKSGKKIIIASGFKPGFSSDMAAVLLAKQLNAKAVINITAVDYVYDKDPHKHKNAKRIVKIAWKDFVKLMGSKWVPGIHAPFDPVASKAARNLGLKVIIAGKNLKNLERIFLNKRHHGTLIY